MSGVVGITYANREPADVCALLEYVRQNAASLRIDADRLGLWSCSGHAPSELPLFIARAGLDQMPGLNLALDTFIAKGLSANLPLTVVNHAAGPHAFDLFDDSQTSREIVRQVLAFLRFHLASM